MSNHHHNHSEQTPECQALLAQLGDYIDGELEQSLCAEIEQHLADCNDCRVLVDTTRKTVLLYRQQGQQNPVELPAEITGRLWQKLDEEGCISSAD